MKEIRETKLQFVVLFCVCPHVQVDSRRNCETKNLNPDLVLPRTPGQGCSGSLHDAEATTSTPALLVYWSVNIVLYDSVWVFGLTVELQEEAGTK